MKRFNIAVVGCGNVSRMHFEAYQSHSERIQIVAACDPDSGNLQQAQQQYGFAQGFASLEEMLAHAEWEVAVVCTPTPIRKPVVEALAAAGKHIFVEKPFADSYTVAQHMVNTCAQAGVQLAVNQNFRYHYPFEKARELIAQGQIGRVVNIVQQDLMFRQDKGWRIQTRRHALSVMGVHWLDGLRWLLQDTATSLICETRSSATIESVGETDAAVQITFKQGALASYVESFSSPISRTETLILGETGALVLTYRGLSLFDLKDSSQPRLQWENPLSGSHKPEATFIDLNLLLAALEQGEEPVNSGRDNLQTIALLDGAYRSAEEQRPIIFNEGVPV
ncbi:oxidoreductase [Reticulibacter mediterranei]|uniref:Oxidoreductase n=1 Tax=Reticulibacter mediterranei TaxID=2778369 RepID=A0A8J3ILP2_9CHLR|nr:Gfo/Idh/MocA family oxidoreductase [Reticulibacter mediterranei]GHO93537.1 oxidoreductase [Reticulibacter mediterranei]